MVVLSCCRWHWALTPNSNTWSLSCDSLLGKPRIKPHNCLVKRVRKNDVLLSAFVIREPKDCPVSSFLQTVRRLLAVGLCWKMSFRKRGIFVLSRVPNKVFLKCEPSVTRPICLAGRWFVVDNIAEFSPTFLWLYIFQGKYQQRINFPLSSLLSFSPLQSADLRVFTGHQIASCPLWIQVDKSETQSPESACLLLRFSVCISETSQVSFWRVSQALSRSLD